MVGLRERAAEGLQVGDSFKISRTFTDDDVVNFAGISRDYNPVHFDARATVMNFRFKGPVYVGETITCNWVITDIDQKGRAKASVTITKQDGATVIEAEIGGVVPGDAERKVLSQMLSEGDPTNGLTNK